MKSIFICGVILALSLCCRAEEGADENNMKIWTDIKTKLCKPDTIDDKTVTAFVECKKQLMGDKMKGNKEIYEKCGAPNEKDIAGYTKVDLTKEDNKKTLMCACSESYKKCGMDFMKKKHQDKSEGTDNPKGSKKGRFTDEQMKTFNDCVAKALP